MLLENKMKNKSKNNKNRRLIIKSGLFNKCFYLINNPDVKASKVDPITHYLECGARELRNPSCYFDTNFYIETYQDVKESGMNPLVHYITYGKNEGRKINSNNLEPNLLKRVTKIVSSVYHHTKTQNCFSASKENFLNAKTEQNVIPKISFDDTKDEFIEYKENSKINSDVKLIAFYLPQFHPFPENDKWWGKGFTEWSNVTKAKPNFKGHYQPHLPIHNGFYDLRVPEVMIEQAKLAKNYGVYGFNFYYYWFDGKILMHKPFEILLEHKEIDINFCITWANENWTRRWDGAANDILIGQNHCESDSIKFIENLYKYFNDNRYIRIDNKPVLIIYRVDIIPNIKETVSLWRRKMTEAGYDGIYLICSQAFGIKSPLEYGFDAAMEFPPHTVKSDVITNELKFYNKKYNGFVFDYNKVVENAIRDYKEEDYKVFRTAMLSWDNTARKQDGSHIFHNFSLLRYKQWLSNIVNKISYSNKYSKDEKLVFVNAWNEWAEGTHLEPDRKFGYGYLQSSYDVLKNYNNNLLDFSCIKPEKNNETAVILHIHYSDVWDCINSYLSNLKSYGFDLYVTLTNTDNEIVSKIKKEYPAAHIYLVENRGRDILPFIQVLKILKNLDYKRICKIHSKKSLYRDDGSQLREELYSSLLSKNSISMVFSLFDKDPTLGFITSKKYLIPHTHKNMYFDKDLVISISKSLNLDFTYSKFSAGSMYWFIPEALSGLEYLPESAFDIEKGLADGTNAHAVERIVCLLVKKNLFKLKGI